MSQFPGSLVDIEYYLPEKVINNNYFRKKYPEWRVDLTEKRTGVYERRIVNKDQTAYDLALIAAKKMLIKYPGLDKKIDAIIFCTQSPDYIMPSNAFLLHRDLNLRDDLIAFDYNLACSGYIYGLFIASSFIKTGLVKNALVITADTYSKYLAKKDRATRMLFGDGASVSWVSNDNNPSLIKSFESFKFSTDGNGWDKFIIESGGARNPNSFSNSINRNKILMNGLNVLNLVNGRVIEQIKEILKDNNLKVFDVEKFFIHQASGIALESISHKLKINQNQLFSNLNNVGNTVSSSIPILIKDYFSRNELAADSKVLLCGFGVGYSCGSLLAKI